MKRVCLDNHILIWGIRGICTPGQETMIRRSQALMEDLDEADANILVPAVVVSEFLAGVPKPQHQELINALNRLFQVAPFDIRTAAVAAGLWRDAAERNPSWKVLLQETFPGTTHAKPGRCRWEGSDRAADSFARRGVSEARASSRPVTSEGRSSCERRSSKHDRSNCIVPARIKADIMILATALVRKADILYTHDGPLRAIAADFLDVRDLPPARPEQPNLPL